MNFHPFGRLRGTLHFGHISDFDRDPLMMPSAKLPNPDGRRKSLPASLNFVVSAKALLQTSGGVQVYEGRLQTIEGQKARILFAEPLPEGCPLTILVEFKDKKEREIRFRYEGRVASSGGNAWFEAAIDFDEGVSISGRNARELLSELFPDPYHGPGR
ncbi:MAG TPA: hypothetical protein VFC10_19725 [Terriglobia bacterium]|jgi:hypothetical protein|nr:hypothetical protein [Terriglobia bacterium]